MTIRAPSSHQDGKNSVTMAEKMALRSMTEYIHYEPGGKHHFDQS